MFRLFIVSLIVIGLLWAIVAIDKRPIMQDTAFEVIQKIELTKNYYKYRYLLTTGEEFAIDLSEFAYHDPEFWFESNSNYNVGDTIWMGARWGKHNKPKKE